MAWRESYKAYINNGERGPKQLNLITKITKATDTRIFRLANNLKTKMLKYRCYNTSLSY